jgi:hypothetical protein
MTLLVLSLDTYSDPFRVAYYYYSGQIYSAVSNLTTRGGELDVPSAILIRTGEPWIVEGQVRLTQNNFNPQLQNWDRWWW